VLYALDLYNSICPLKLFPKKPSHNRNVERENVRLPLNMFKSMSPLILLQPHYVVLPPHTLCQMLRQMSSRLLLFQEEPLDSVGVKRGNMSIALNVYNQMSFLLYLHDLFFQRELLLIGDVDTENNRLSILMKRSVSSHLLFWNQN